MGFTNFLREMDDRTIGGKRMMGWVVGDPSEDKTQTQRLRIRIHDLHDDIPDDKLPYFSAGNTSPYSGAANMGDHGPIPPQGSKVWISFGDSSQYHGLYHGGVQTTENKVPEFTDKGEFGSDYGHVYGGVNSSGTLSATNTNTDAHMWEHVSGTSYHVDGKGNTNVVVSGNAANPNVNAGHASTVRAQRYGASSGSGGLNTAVFGALNIYVSGVVNIGCGGNATIAANGKATLSAKGDLAIVSGGALTLVGSSIKSSVDIVTGASGTPATVAAQTAPAVRSRPNPVVKKDSMGY